MFNIKSKKRYIPGILFSFFNLLLHRTKYKGDFIMRSGKFVTDDCQQARLWGNLYAIFEEAYVTYHHRNGDYKEVFSRLFSAAIKSPNASFSRIQGRFRIYIRTLKRGHLSSAANDLVSCWDEAVVALGGELPRRLNVEQKAAFEYGVCMKRQELKRDREDRKKKTKDRKQSKEDGEKRSKTVDSRNSASEKCAKSSQKKRAVVSK